MFARIRHTAILLALFLTLDASFVHDIVRTTNGWVRGSREITQRKQVEFVAYRGIPYAKPPIDDLRFKVNLMNILLEIELKFD